MTAAMATHQDLTHERLQPSPEDATIYHRHQPAWLPRQAAAGEDQETGFYRMPKRNKRKNFKPRCAPNSVSYNSDESNTELRSELEDPGSPADGAMESDHPATNINQMLDPSRYMRIGVKNFNLLKASGAVDLSSGRFSTDSNENIEDQSIESQHGLLSFMDHQKRFDSRFQQSYVNSLQISESPSERTHLIPKDYAAAKNFSAKNPFAISQLIKTNSPPRRRSDDNSEDTDTEKSRGDINANERSSFAENDSNHDPNDSENVEDDLQNGSQPVANRMLREYAMNTMKELLGIYGLSSNEVNEALTNQVRHSIESLQGAVGLKRRYATPGGLGEVSSDRRPRRSPSVTTEDEQGSNNVTPSRSPERDENMYNDIQRQRALQFLSQHTMSRLLDRRSSLLGNEDQDNLDDRGSPSSNLEIDGDQTLDLSVSKDGDAQDLSTTSSAGNSVAEFEHQNMLMRRNMEDLASLQMQGMFQKPSAMLDHEDLLAESRAKLAQSSLLASLGHLDPNRKAITQPAVDYSRYVKRYTSAVECGSSYCKELSYREHFHCMDCTARVFCKKEEMIRHFKWHKKRDESLAHGFMRYSPLDDCSERYSDCPHNRSQTHYHCIKDGCDKTYISTSDVQMHANYHRKDSAILQEGFQRFRATETCSAPHCAFQGQRTTHFHCRRTGCTYTFKNKADMEKHKTYHIKDEQLARDGFKKYMKNEPCPYRECRFSRACNHIHCIRPRCNYVLHSSSQLFSHKRKHERKEQEMGFALPPGMLANALMHQSSMEGSVRVKPPSTPPGFNMEPDDSSMSSLRNQGIMAAGPMDMGLGGDPLAQHHNMSQMVLDEVARKLIEIFEGGADPDDKCKKCSALNKHYHCIADGCTLAHSCHNTMLKHALEHEHQNQVTEAFFVTNSKTNPCNNSACHHIREVTHYHCTWENCGCVILASEEHPFKRLEHHRQHAILGPLSPNLASRLTPNLASQLAGHVPTSFSQIPSLPPNLAQIAQMAPSLAAQLAPTLHTQLTFGNSSPVVQHTPNMNSSLDEMFSRKRGRPPKNRVVEVYTDHTTPQAIFTSFKLPKNSLSPVPQQASLNSAEEFSKIKFPNFDVFTVPDSCLTSVLLCPYRPSKIHFHCAHCNYTVDNHTALETHCREVHSIIQLMDGFDFYPSSEQCNGRACIKFHLKAHFHCTQSPNCTSVLSLYSALATHKHGKMTPLKIPEMDQFSDSNHTKFDQVKDYSIKREPLEAVSSMKAEAILNIEGYPHGVLTIKSENQDNEGGSSNMSVVKATGTFYPSSHVNKSNPTTPSPSKNIESPLHKPVPNLLPTAPASCSDPHCSLNKKSGQIQLHYHCSICSQAYVDTKLLYGHMMKKHSQYMEGNTTGLAATKETLEREYPEISILPSTASSSASSPVQLRHPTQNDQVQAVHNLLLQQYLSASSMQQVQKGLSLQDQLKYQQQLNASLASSIPGISASQLAQMAFLSQGGSPFPLYPPMLYPPELLLEQGLLGPGGPSSGLSIPTMDKESADMLAKKTHNVRSAPSMRLLKDEPIPEGYLRFRFNEDCAYQHCGYREHQTHFHCTRKDCGYSFCDKTRFVQHTARHERLDTLMGGDFQQYRANVFCGRQDCAHASNYGTGQNKASHFHCLKCEFVCTDTNKVVAHRRQHQKMDSIQAAGFEKFPPSKGCGFDPQCIHSRKQTHYHCLQCGFAVLGLSQMTSHKYRHQDTSLGAGTSGTS